MMTLDSERASFARRKWRCEAMTDQELHDYAADHLYYELWMLYETALKRCNRTRLS